MYYVNKIIGWSLSPLGIFFLGMSMGLLLRQWKAWRTCGAVVCVLAVAQLWFFSCGFVTHWIGLPLEWDEVDALQSPSADAIVLLGGGMGCHKECGRPEVLGGADRVWMAARLFKAGKAPLMTVSGGGAKGELPFLFDMGVDTNKVCVLESARNTEEEATMVKCAISANSAVRRPASSLPKILLVTSAWHMPRAKMLFERAGFEVVAAPTDYEMHFASEFPCTVCGFFPCHEDLMRNSYAVKEWVARVCYALKGIW